MLAKALSYAFDSLILLLSAFALIQRSPYHGSSSVTRLLVFVSSVQFSRSNIISGGDEENRTPDPLLARQVLSQLSYAPVFPLLSAVVFIWWA